MKSVGLSETFHGLLDMEFVHLYKPELKSWRGLDLAERRWVEECVDRCGFCLPVKGFKLQTGQQSGSSLARKNREG
jgi:hypothetical protein